MRPKPVPETNSRNVQEMAIPPDKRQEILNAGTIKLRQVS